MGTAFTMPHARQDWLHEKRGSGLPWTCRGGTESRPARRGFLKTQGRVNTFAWVLPAILVAAVACAFALVPSAKGDPSAGCDLVASTAGSDAAPGTLSQPFRTVQKVVNSLGPGQTGCLRGTAALGPFS